MSRRSELRGVCNDFLDRLVSRYNVIDGYWALGFFQAELLDGAGETLVLDAFGDNSFGAKLTSNTPIPYRAALAELLAAKGLTLDRVSVAQLKVEGIDEKRVLCTLTLKSDLGREFRSEREVAVRRHDPRRELKNRHG